MKIKPYLTLLLFLLGIKSSYCQTTILTNVRPLLPPSFLGWDGTGPNPGPLEIRNNFTQPINFFTDGTPRMTIRGQAGFNQGFVGINTGNPQSRLTVIGNASVGTNTAAPANGFRVFGNSYFGGNATPQGIVHIDNSIAAFQLVLESTAPFNPDMTFADNTGVKGQIRYLMAGTRGLGIAANNANMAWTGLTNEQIFINGTTGRIGLGIGNP